VVARESQELMNLFKQGSYFKGHTKHFDEQFKDVDWSHARESVGMEKCDDWEAVVNEAGQDTTPAKHANMCMIPSNKGTQRNSMEAELYSNCKDVDGGKKSSMDNNQVGKQ
jgi:hypothetical protein